MKRYPGSIPFPRQYEKLFFGRTTEIDALARYVTVDPISVLHGKSGLGKTSLITAGLLPRLSQTGSLNVLSVRLNCYREDVPSRPLEILQEAVAGFSSGRVFLSTVEADNVSLWQQLKGLQMEAERDVPFLLVFDQFEELFTYPSGVDEFVTSLADLHYDRMPKALRRKLGLHQRLASEPLPEETEKLLEQPLEVRFLFSIRSDRMSEIDELSPYLPNVLRHCYELRHLSRDQVIEAITKPARMEGGFDSPPFEYEPDALDRILGYLTQEGKAAVETFQLQILCAHIEDHVVIGQGQTTVKGTSLGNLETIYGDYYESRICTLGDAGQQESAHRMVEEGLVFEKEDEVRRVPLYEGQVESDYGMDQELRRKLVDTHLVRAEPHPGGGYIYELSHDSLLRPVLEAKRRRQLRDSVEREERRLEERKSKQLRTRWKLLGVVFLLVAPYVWFLWAALRPVRWGDAGLLPCLAVFPALVMTLLIALSPVYVLHEWISEESLLARWRRRREQAGSKRSATRKVLAKARVPVIWLLSVVLSLLYVGLGLVLVFGEGGSSSSVVVGVLVIVAGLLVLVPGLAAFGAVLMVLTALAAGELSISLQDEPVGAVLAIPGVLAVVLALLRWRDAYGLRRWPAARNGQ